MKKEKVVNAAKKKLLDNPFDIAHDIFHHHKVWENVLLITIGEKLDLDLDKLEIASWWHDYERGSVKHKTLMKTMQEADFPQTYIKSVVDLINTHSFSDERSEAKEAKVLFDADKIEYVNPGRMVWMGEGILSGSLSAQIGQKYGQALQERIFIVARALHYHVSRSIMISNIESFITMLPVCKVRYGNFLLDVKEKELAIVRNYLKSATS